jgi:hypothetical protein
MDDGVEGAVYLILNRCGRLAHAQKVFLAEAEGATVAHALSITYSVPKKESGDDGENGVSRVSVENVFAACGEEHIGVEIYQGANVIGDGIAAEIDSRGGNLFTHNNVPFLLCIY